MTKKYLFTSIACLIVFMTFMVASVTAETIAVHGNPADRPIFTDNGDLGKADKANIVYGTLSGSERELAAVLVFELPDLGGRNIETADLTITAFRYSADGDPNFDVDLIGIGWRSGSPDVITGDQSGGTIIQDDDFVITDPNPMTGDKFSTDDDADAALAAFLTSAYAGGAQSGDYVFFRMNPDNWVVSEEVALCRVEAGDNANPDIQPLLTITTVPEPGTLMLMALGVLFGLFSAGRRSVK